MTETTKAVNQGRERHENPYADMDDDELEAMRHGLLAAYVQRLEYFDTLPAFMHDDFAEIHAQGPEKWGISRCEWDAHVLDLWEHIGEALTLADVRNERSKRLSNAAYAAVISCDDYDTGTIEQRGADLRYALVSD